MTLMTSRQRLWMLLFSGLTIVALVLLASGLNGLELLPGRPLPFGKQATGDTPLPAGGTLGSELLRYVFMAIFGLAVVLFPFAIIYVIVSPDARKRIVRSLGLLMWLLAFYLLTRANPEFFQELQLQPSAAPFAGNAAVPGVEFSASIPPWAVPLATIGLAVLLAAALVAIAWFIWRRSRRTVSPLEQLAQEARQALVALEGGADVNDTVMRCYFEMSQILSQQHGISRAQTMTPREFELELKGAGLPDEDVEQLTRLFESVRYGARVPDEQQERQAVACLMAIAESCTGSP
jgi:uncharacterized SAM-binding protein YcdF (DUF218 family)